MIKRILAIILLLSLLLAFVSCKDEENPYSHAELVLPLSEDYYEIQNEDFDKCYTNGTVTAAIMRISFAAAEKTGISDTYTAYQFAQFWLIKTEREANIIRDAEYVYCDFLDGGTFYLEAFYRSKYAYFVVLCATREDMEEEYKSGIIEYVKGVQFV